MTDKKENSLKKKRKKTFRRLRSEGMLEKFLLGFFTKKGLHNEMNTTLDNMEVRVPV